MQLSGNPDFKAWACEPGHISARHTQTLVIHIFLCIHVVVLAQIMGQC
jgi:hypothetical protein